MDDRALARWRMHTLRLAGTPYRSVADAVDGLLAVQAEQYVHASWAVATRTSGTSRDHFQQLFDDGEVLRTHVLRPTWHFVRPDDIQWLLELTAPRIRRSLTQQQRALDVTDDALESSAEVIADALAGGVHLTRAALAERLNAEGITTEGLRLSVHLESAELSGLICSGRMEGRHHTHALLDERAPAARRLRREDAVAELVLRYFRGHGPATERDLAYWATMTLRDVRAGLEVVAGQLDHLEHDGRTFWFADAPPDATHLEPRAHLLLVLDEYHNGYQDSRHVLDADGLRPRGRHANLGMTLVDGQMVGDVRRTARGDTVTFEVRLFRDVGSDESEAIHAAAQRYGSFMGAAETHVVLSR